MCQFLSRFFTRSLSIFENRSLIIFPIRNEHELAHGTYFLFETRLLVGFQIGNERSGGPFRYFDRRTIFHPQTLRATGIWIFPTQTFLVASTGGDVTENIDFQSGKVSLQGPIFVEGSDLNENVNFTNGKYVHMIYINNTYNTVIYFKNIRDAQAVF